MRIGTRLAGLVASAVWLAMASAPTLGQGSPAAGSFPSSKAPSSFAKPAPWPQSPWVKGHNSAARLIAGAEPLAGGRRLVLGVEITLAEGWKTYWRHPGDDGGLPPTFGLEQSRNLGSAVVKYPAPERLKSFGGTAVGYSRSVVFPIVIEAKDASRPVEVELTLDYGICKDICVPAEAKLALTIAPSLAAMPPELAASLARVPEPVSGAAAAKILRSAKALLTGALPAITFEVNAKDLFVLPPAGFELPVPAAVGEAGGAQRFRIDLKNVHDAPKLAGSTLKLIATGPGGNFELDWLVK